MGDIVSESASSPLAMGTSVSMRDVSGRVVGVSESVSVSVSVAGGDGGVSTVEEGNILRGPIAPPRVLPPSCCWVVRDEDAIQNAYIAIASRMRIRVRQPIMTILGCKCRRASPAWMDILQGGERQSIDAILEGHWGGPRLKVLLWLIAIMKYLDYLDYMN